MVRTQNAPLFRTSTVKSHLLNPSPYQIALFITSLFLISLFFTFYWTRNILDDEQSSLQRSEASRSDKVIDDKLWTAPSSYNLHPCVNATAGYRVAYISCSRIGHYIIVKSNGGLNQMRTGISDMVVVAHIMNATLIIPQLDRHSFWQDSSIFSDIFDEQHFIKTLERDVMVLKELPKELDYVPHARKHFTSWSGMSYYEGTTLALKDYKDTFHWIRIKPPRRMEETKILQCDAGGPMDLSDQC